MVHSEKNEEKIRYNSIDGLRSFAALGIITMHVQANGGYCVDNYVCNNIIPFFTNFVFLFMIVSGFAVCCGYFEKILNNVIDINIFYAKRLKKIWPFFSVLVLLDVLLSRNIESFYEAFADLTLCFALLPNPQITVIGVGWTLGIIFLFYIFFPFFVFLLANKKRAWCILGISLVFNYICIQYFFTEKFVNESFVPRTNFIYCFVYFVVGGVIYLYKNNISKIITKYKVLCIIWTLIITLCYFYFGIEENDGVIFTILLIILFSSWIMVAIGTNSKILSNKFTKFISEISFEIYLSHMVSYRIIEKMNLLHLFDNDVLSLLLSTVFVTCGAIGLSLGINMLLKVAVKKIRSGEKSHED